MNKLYKSFLAGAALFMLTPPLLAADAPENLYFIGNILNNSFSPGNSLQATSTEPGVFVFENVTLSNSGTSYFAFTTVGYDNWDLINDGSHRYGGGSFNLSGTDLTLGKDVSWTIADGTYTFTADFNTGKATAVKQDHVDLYLIGQSVDGDSWALGTNKFNYDSSTQKYTWSGSDLRSSFKINSGAWSNGYNLGPDGSDKIITESSSVTLVNNGDSKNVILQDGYYLQNPTLEFDLSSMQLSIKSGTLALIPGPDKFYWKGTFNGWDDSWVLDNNGENVYTNTFNIYKSDSDIEFKFFDGSAWYGASGDANVTLSYGSPTELTLGSDGSNWKLTNWNGGSVEVTINWSDKKITLTASEEYIEEPSLEAPENLYLIGDLVSTGGNWTPNNPRVFTKNSDGTFSLSNVSFMANDENTVAYLRFTNLITEDWKELENGEHCYGPQSNNSLLNLGSDNNFILTSDNTWTIEPGSYNFVVDFETQTVTISEGEEIDTPPTPDVTEVPEHLYLCGNLYAYNNALASDWNPENPIEFIADEDNEGIFTLVGVEFSGNDDGLAYFTFLNNKGSWDELNAGEDYRYGPTVEANVTVDQASDFKLYAVGEEPSWNVVAGVYDFKVDFNTMSFIVSESDVEPFVPEIPETLETPDKLYLLGDTYAYNEALVEAWNPEKPIAFTADPEEEGVFTLIGVELTGEKSYFCFTNAVGTWDELNAGEDYRYGSTTLKQEEISVDEKVNFTLFPAGMEANFILSAGVYDFVVNFNTATFAVAKSDVEHYEPEPEISDVPEHLYLVGDIEDNAWNTTKSLELEQDKSKEGVFSVENVHFVAAENSNMAYFTLINIQSDDWTVINDGTHRYGPAVNGVKAEVAPKTTNFYLGKDVSWTLESGTYSFSVDFTTGAMTVTLISLDEPEQEPDGDGEGDGDNEGEGDNSGDDEGDTSKVSSLENDNAEEVIYNLQGVRVDRNKISHGIFIINGKKVFVK